MIIKIHDGIGSMLYDLPLACVKAKVLLSDEGLVENIIAAVFGFPFQRGKF